MLNRPDPNPNDHFIEQMGLIAQSDNGPRIAGRIFGLLVIEGRPWGLQAMSERLQVSKASISTNVRLLAEQGLLKRVAKPGDRQDYYELASDPYNRMLQKIGEKLQAAAEMIAEAEKLIPPDNDGARQRVGELTEFYRQSARVVMTLSNRLPKTATADGKYLQDFNGQDADSDADKQKA